MRDYTLDLQTTVEFEVDVRRRNLMRSNHYTKVVKEIIDGVLHYLLYKSKKPTRARFYPIAGRVSV